MPKHRDLITEFPLNTQIGDWTIVGYSTKQNGKNQLQSLLLKCKCGQEVNRRPSDLESGESTGCGCSKGLKTKQKLCLTYEQIKSKLPPEIDIDFDTYINGDTKCRFIHSILGEFYAYVYNVIKGQSNHPLINIEKRRQTANSLTHFYLRYHWKTNEKLMCQGGWEAKVVDYLNKNYIEYLWQPETFKLSTGRTYRPDLYLINEDKWVEIKGWFRPGTESLNKWNEFHTLIKTNSELWNKDKLKQLTIL